ncbi:MAG: hypothetical protein JSW20_08395 [Nitrospiraceae bacterium]|nr:MAG: hypothetical protein JSW20_08395 [Nitrospiraceae bacterium]
MLEPIKITMYSGGHRGTEEYFGKAAEQWGMQEVTLNFEGHEISRDRGLKILTEDELSRGGVSSDIISKRMERSFARTPFMQNIFKVQFHIVNSGYQVFAAGWLLSNGTVKGGTGWGVELAKLFNRPVHLFEQERKEWVSWVNNEWVMDEPVISHKTLGVTGTRYLSDEGKQAIDDLFNRSFKTSDS